MKRHLAVGAVAVFVVVAGVAFVAMKGDDSTGQPTYSARKPSQSSGAPLAADYSNTAAAATQGPPLDPEEPTPEEAEAQMVAITSRQAFPTPTPDIPTAIDPESQPRDFKTEYYRGLDAIPSGFSVTNMILTADGFALDPNAPFVNGFRSGEVVSDAKPTGFPSNAFVPMWRENIPDGSDLQFEFQVSPNGRDWSAWRMVEIDEESMAHRSTTMPDGTPNPNAEWVLGGLHAWPEEQWSHFRYRVTLQSQTSESPLFEGFRLYHMDSTLGGGRLAELSPSNSSGREDNPTVTP